LSVVILWSIVDTSAAVDAEDRSRRRDDT